MAADCANATLQGGCQSGMTAALLFTSAVCRSEYSWAPRQAQKDTIIRQTKIYIIGLA